METFHVVVGMIPNAEGELLIARRTQNQYKPGLWEFPGGKVERGEMPFVALQRELFEEIGIRVITAERWCQLGHDYSDRIVFLDVWIVRRYQGEPHGAEDQPVCWVRPDSLKKYSFPEGNQRLIERWCLEYGHR